VTEKTTYQLLLEMAPKEMRGDIEKILRNYKQVENENDGLFQVIMVMGIYQNYLSNIPAEIKNAVWESTFEVGEINAGIERKLKFFMIAIYAGIVALGLMLFLIPKVCIQKNISCNAESHALAGENKIELKRSDSEDFRELPVRNDIE